MIRRQIRVLCQSHFWALYTRHLFLSHIKSNQYLGWREALLHAVTQGLLVENKVFMSSFLPAVRNLSHEILFSRDLLSQHFFFCSWSLGWNLVNIACSLNHAIIPVEDWPVYLRWWWVNYQTVSTGWKLLEGIASIFIYTTCLRGEGAL